MKISFGLYKGLKNKLTINDTQLNRLIQIIKVICSGRDIFIPQNGSLGYNSVVSGEIVIKNMGSRRYATDDGIEYDVEVYRYDTMRGLVFDVIVECNGDVYYYINSGKKHYLWTGGDMPDELRELLNR